MIYTSENKDKKLSAFALPEHRLPYTSTYWRINHPTPKEQQKKEEQLRIREETVQEDSDVEFSSQENLDGKKQTER